MMQKENTGGPSARGFRARTTGKKTGHAVCLPADIDTDVVIAGRYSGPRTGVYGVHTSSRISILELHRD